jgi:predicted nucleic acid-binding protein
VSVDSSLLVSLYINDSNSASAAERMCTPAVVWLSPLNCSELAHAIQRYVFRRRLTDFEARRAWTQFEGDCAKGAWELIGFPDSVWRASIDLARRHGPTLGIRTLDSLHVACALELRAERFWTFDERQRQLAEAAGLDTTG